MRAILVTVLSLLLTLPTLAATFTVNNLGDLPDATPGNAVCDAGNGVCTLRAAIQEANALAGADVIQFSVAGTITPATALPSLTQQTTIDATTAPGYSNAPVVTIDGAASIVNGISFAATADHSRLSGLRIYGFTSGAVSVSSDNTTITDNYLGPVGGGTPNMDGLELFGANNIIGGAAGAGNVISGNTRFGIYLAGSGHRISANNIGMTPSGLMPLSNGDDGIRVLANATNIDIGSIVLNEHNLISENRGDGVEIANATFIRVYGNLIGPTGDGMNEGYAQGAGVNVSTFASDITIGHLDARTVISSNTVGVLVEGTRTTIVNTILGLTADGDQPLRNFVAATILGSNNTIRASVISGNREGLRVGPNASNILVEDNLVGLTPTGATGRGNELDGVGVTDSTGITIRGNWIGSHNVTIPAISLFSSNNVEIRNNRIGTIPDAPSGRGIHVLLGENITIAQNVISFNSGTAVTITGPATALVELNTFSNNRYGVNIAGGTVIVRRNSISNNARLGIEVGPEGVTPNDAGDADAGPNALQNFPVITSATPTQIHGTINTTANTPVAIELFSSPAPDPTGYGEGNVYLGTVNVTTDASGNAAFNFNTGGLPVGSYVSSTATGPGGTSEFSQSVIVTGELPTIAIGDLTQSEGNSGTATFTFNVTLSAPSATPITVDYTTADGTATAGADYAAASGTITFAPGEVAATVSITVVADANGEGNETFVVNLTNANGATITDAQGTGTITNDDAISAADIPTASEWGLLALALGLALLAMMKMR